MVCKLAKLESPAPVAGKGRRITAPRGWLGTSASGQSDAVDACSDCGVIQGEQVGAASCYGVRHGRTVSQSLQRGLDALGELRVQSSPPADLSALPWYSSR